MKRLVISIAYGADRYAAGLRIVRKDQLSDGTRLPAMYEFLYSFGTFICVGIVMVSYGRLLQYWGLLRDDEQRAGRTSLKDEKKT